MSRLEREIENVLYDLRCCCIDERERLEIKLRELKLEKRETQPRVIRGFFA